MITEPANATTVSASSDEDGFPEFLASVRASLATQTANNAASRPPLFRITQKNLYNAFLNALPEERRQHYNCSACRLFVNRYGGLVTLDESGHQQPVMWEPSSVPKLFRAAVAALYQVVSEARVGRVFLSADADWGNSASPPDKAGRIWSHLAVKPRDVYLYQPVLDENGRKRTAGQQMAFLREEHNLLAKALAEVPIEHIRAALSYLESGALRRADRQVEYARWLCDAKDARDRLDGTRRHNYLWRTAALAPAGFCHVRSGMLGTLIEDIEKQLSFEQIKARFEAKMAGYQRSTTAPTETQLRSAERIVEELGIAASLPRRYARLDEIAGRLLWQPGQELRGTDNRPAVDSSARKPTSGVFAHLAQTPARAEPTIIDGVPAQSITLEKFRRTVLPRANRLEVQVPTRTTRFMALTTAADPSAPPLLQWDQPEQRNPFSWYYEAGVDAEIRERVIAAGGRYEDADLRCSLIWSNTTDLDLHCITPRGEQIGFHHRQASCSGWLDVDANAGALTSKPVENIAWGLGQAPRGRYRFYVLNYRDRNGGHNPFSVELSVGGEVHRVEGELSRGVGTYVVDAGVLAFEFDYAPGRPIVMHGKLDGRQVAPQSAPSSWNLQPGTFAEVTGIALSPNLWNGDTQKRHGSHVFFLLRGCRDLQEGRGRGFFTEHLRGELHPVRKTLEAFARTAVIAGADAADTCGIGLSDQVQDWNLVVRAHSASSATLYRIDRWD